MPSGAFRKKKTSFAQVSNVALRDETLSLKAKGLLAMILSLPDDWNYSINGLVSICKENITAVRNSLKELESFGHVVIEKTKNERGQFVYNYTIYEIPVDSPPIEKPIVDNVDMEKQVVDNQHQLNKDVLSTKEKVFNKDLYIKEHANAAIWSPLNDYLEMRKEIGIELTERGLKLLLNRLEKLSNNNVTMQRLMLENATRNKWKNVYKPKDEEIEAASQALINELKQFYNI